MHRMSVASINNRNKITTSSHLHRMVLFEDNSNNNNYCDCLTDESDHGFKFHNNSEAFQQLRTTSMLICRVAFQ